MFDMILENYRKATESTMKLQQDVLRNWTMQWPQMFGAQTFGLPFLGGSTLDSAMPGAAGSSNWAKPRRSGARQSPTC